MLWVLLGSVVGPEFETFLGRKLGVIDRLLIGTYVGIDIGLSV